MFKNKIINQSSSETFNKILNELCTKYRPSKHRFFENLAQLSTENLSPTVLGELYLRYQSACHATRVMVYHLPYLDSPSLRIRKLKLLIDDDGLENGDTHHYQLSRAFTNIGAVTSIKDNEFGELDNLKKILDLDTVKFISLVQRLYPQSLGAWCVVEALAEDWMIALRDSLSCHFPIIINEQYFADCINEGVEKQHAQESLNLTCEVLVRSPELLTETVDGASRMAIGINQFWTGLEVWLDKNLFLVSK